MDLDDYNPSYDRYTFFRLSIVAGDDITYVEYTAKNYLEVPQAPPPYTPYAADSSVESFNQSKKSIPVWYALIDNQSKVDVFRNTYLLANI